MARLAWVKAALLAWCLPGCFQVSTSATDRSGDSAHVSVDQFDLSTAEVADGDAVDVSWSVSHTTTTGYVTNISLYLGGADGLDAAPSSRQLFSLAVTAGAPNDVSTSSQNCKRTGTNLKCDSGSTRDITGVSELTLRACTSYVLDTAETCDTQTKALSFP